MNQFSNLSELIEHCSYCVLCKKETSISYTLGPDELFQLQDNFIKDDILTFNTTYKYSTISEDDLLDGEPRPYTKYFIDFFINIKDNTYKIFIKGPISELSTDIYKNKASKSVPYLFIESVCDECKSFSFSRDIDIDLLKNQLNISDICLDIKTINLIKTDKKYQIKYDFDINQMRIYNVNIIKNNNLHFSINRIGNPVKLPIYDIDFSNEEEAISKIKMYIVFS